MANNLRGKVALVTGASSGLGRHFAKVLAAAGATVILAARRQPALDEVAAIIKGDGGLASTLILDVTDHKNVSSLEAALTGVDIVVNNAGVVQEAPALQQTEAAWDQVIDTNLKGAFLIAQMAARAMQLHGRGGSIINVASILGLRQAGGVLPYAVSKSGVIQLTKVLALELARYGIRVNALAPGYLDTELNTGFLASESGQSMMRRIPMRRAGRLEELDGPLLLLASEDSSYMTGAVLTVDGGHLVSSL